MLKQWVLLKEGREGPATFEARKIAEAEQPTVKKRLLREEIRYNEFETVRTRENWRERNLDDTITLEILQVGKGPKGKQRQADIDCQNDINNPDRELMNILLTQLEEAQTKIKELDG